MKSAYRCWSTPLPHYLIVAVLLRLLWACFIPVEPVSDSSMYRAFAMQIAGGLGYSYPSGEPTAYWAVGAAGFYALFHLLFGTSNLPVLAANLFLGVGLVFTGYMVCAKLIGERAGVVAGWLLALWPGLIQFTTVYASELLFIFLVLAALGVWMSSRGVWWLRAMFWGALLCAATYVRPTALPLFLILPALDYLRNRNRKVAAEGMAVAVCTAALLFAPWVVRNLQIFGSPVLVSVNFGTNLWMGNNPLSDGGYMELPDHQFTNEVERDRYFKNQAVEFIKSNPGEYLKLAVRRAVMTYDRETIGVAWNEPALRQLFGERGLLVMKLVSTGYWWLMLGLGVCGIVLLLRQDWTNLFHPLVVVAGFFFMVPILTVGQDRYHMPLNPFLAMFAAIAIDAAWRRYIKAGRE